MLLPSSPARSVTDYWSREQLGDKAVFAGGKGLSHGTTAPELHST